MSMDGYQPKGTLLHRYEYIDVLGTWTGQPDELTAKLTELGYVWIIQKGSPYKDEADNDVTEHYLHIASDKAYESISADKDDVVYLEVHAVEDDKDPAPWTRLRSRAASSLTGYIAEF